MLVISRPDGRDLLHNNHKQCRQVRVSGLDTDHPEVVAWTTDGGTITLKPRKVVIDPLPEGALCLRAYMELREDKGYSGEVWLLQVGSIANMSPCGNGTGWRIYSPGE